MSEDTYAQDVLGTVYKSSKGIFKAKWIKMFMQDAILNAHSVLKATHAKNAFEKTMVAFQAEAEASSSLSPLPSSSSSCENKTLDSKEQRTPAVSRSTIVTRSLKNGNTAQPHPQTKNGPLQQQTEIHAALCKELQDAVLRDKAHGFSLDPDKRYEVGTILDPSGGLRNLSELAAVSIICDWDSKKMERRLIVVGAMSLSGGKDTDPKLRHYFKTLYDLPSLRCSEHHIGVESNFGGLPIVHKYLDNDIRLVIPSYTQIQGKPTVDGACTTPCVKPNGARVLQQLFANGQIAFARDFVWVGRESKHEFLKEVEAQLLRMQNVGGKIHGKKPPHGNDDIAICLILIVYWMLVHVS
jgi:hypothetical protein